MHHCTPIAGSLNLDGERIRCQPRQRTWAHSHGGAAAKAAVPLKGDARSNPNGRRSGAAVAVVASPHLTHSARRGSLRRSTQRHCQKEPKTWPTPAGLGREKPGPPQCSTDPAPGPEGPGGAMCTLGIRRQMRPSLLPNPQVAQWLLSFVWRRLPNTRSGPRCPRRKSNMNHRRPQPAISSPPGRSNNRCGCAPWLRSRPTATCAPRTPPDGRNRRATPAREERP